MKRIKAVAASIILLATSNVAFATGTNVVECSTKTGSYDYGNATGQEASACHSSNFWQRFGTESTRESTGSESDLSTNDGVSWRTSTNGTDWSDWTSGELTSGGYVQFQFDVTRAIIGNHKYDQLEAWVDWDQDSDWDDDVYSDQNSSGEQIYSKQWWKDQDSGGNTQTFDSLDQNLVQNNYGSWSDGTKNWDLSTWRGEDVYNSQDTTATFTSAEIQIPVFDALTQVWLRARIVCENSLETLSDGMNLIATGFQNQGEVEDYQLTINTAAKPVPEPSTLFMFALGIVAFVVQRKRV